jgi:hypothetical protein
VGRGHGAEGRRISGSCFKRAHLTAFRAHIEARKRSKLR